MNRTTISVECAHSAHGECRFEDCACICHVPADEKLTFVSGLQIRSRILMEAAEKMCRYCAGTKGHESVPVKRYDRWEHLFTVGNGSNPCAAGPIWAMIEQCCIQMGSQYTPWNECPSCLMDTRDCTCKL